MVRNFAQRLNYVIAGIFLASIAWLVLAGSGGSGLRNLFTLHRGDAGGGAVPDPALHRTSSDSVAISGSDTRSIQTVSGKLIVPVQGVKPAQLVDTFTQSRAEGERLHEATDIMAPVGTPVLSAADGVIEKLHFSHDGGNTIYLRSPDRRTIFYFAHLDSYAPGLHDGQAVRQGEIIGTVGFTGNANPAGPHLHFAVWSVDPAGPWAGEHRALNPYPLLTQR